MDSIRTDQTELAKSKAKVKILIKIIGTLGLIIVALIPYLKCSKEDSKTHYLKILNVMFSDSSNKDIRISGRINETSFSYPSTGLVIKPDNYIPPQHFIVAKDKEGFECYFEVIILDSICQIYDLKPPCPLIIDDFIFSGVYKMELSNSSRNPIRCTIEFKIY